MKIMLVKFSEVQSTPPIPEFLNLLSMRGHKINVICLDGEYKFDDSILPEIQILRFGKQNLSGLKLYFTYVLFFVKTLLYFYKFKPDAIILIDHLTVPIGIILRFLSSVKIVYWNLEIPQKKNRIFNDLLSSLSKMSLKLYRFSIFPSLERFKYCGKFNIKYFILPNAPSKWLISQIKRPFSQHTNDIIIVRTGQLGKNQCIKELIEAFSYLKKRDNLKLLLIGYGREHEIEFAKNLIKLYGVEEKTTLKFNLKRKEVLSLLQNPSIGIANYRMENISTELPASMKVGEYIAFGIPVIVNKTKTWLKLNRLYPAFTFVDKSTPLDIKQSIEELIENPVVLEKMSLNAKKMFEEYYNLERNMEPIIKELES